MKTRVRCACGKVYALVSAGRRGEWRVPDHEEQGRRCSGAGLVVAERGALMQRYAGMEVHDVDVDCDC